MRVTEPLGDLIVCVLRRLLLDVATLIEQQKETGNSKAYRILNNLALDLTRCATHPYLTLGMELRTLADYVQHSGKMMVSALQGSGRSGSHLTVSTSLSASFCVMVDSFHHLVPL